MEVPLSDPSVYGPIFWRLIHTCCRTGHYEAIACLARVFPCIQCRTSILMFEGRFQTYLDPDVEPRILDLEQARLLWAGVGAKLGFDLAIRFHSMVNEKLSKETRVEESAFYARSSIRPIEADPRDLFDALTSSLRVMLHDRESVDERVEDRSQLFLNSPPSQETCRNCSVSVQLRWQAWTTLVRDLQSMVRDWSERDTLYNLLRDTLLRKLGDINTQDLDLALPSLRRETIGFT